MGHRAADCPQGGGGGRGGQRRESSPQDFAWGKAEDEESPEVVNKEEASFGASGLLAAETNTVQGVTIKFTEPEEARLPKKRFRLYVFKPESEDPVDTVHIHRKSAFLIGRDFKVADIAVQHPSCSSQHAVLQYRLIEQETEVYGKVLRSIRPYLMDLESTNGTFIKMDGKFEKIEAARYYELQVGDVFKLGNSTREYVLLHDQAADTPP